MSLAGPLSRFHDEPFDTGYTGADYFFSVQMLTRELNKRLGLSCSKARANSQSANERKSSRVASRNPRITQRAEL